MAKKNGPSIIKLGVFADFHTGHRAGLTPPEYMAGERKYVANQHEKWEWFTATLKTIGPLDGAIFLGDLVDGLGVKDSSETIITDLNRQIDAAVEIIKIIGTRKNFFIYGTHVHVRTRDGLELESEVAKICGNNIYGQLWLGVGKHIIDARHAPAGKSYVETSRANPLIKERLANRNWWMEGVQPLATIYLRAHLHFFYRVGEPGRWEAFLFPALQSPDTKYGRTLSNVVHVGFGTLTFYGDEWPICQIYEAPKCQKTILKF